VASLANPTPLSIAAGKPGLAVSYGVALPEIVTSVQPEQVDSGSVDHVKRLRVAGHDQG
jgi:hypothetical protein